jgi:hypothetical protein
VVGRNRHTKTEKTQGAKTQTDTRPDLNVLDRLRRTHKETAPNLHKRCAPNASSLPPDGHGLTFYSYETEETDTRENKGEKKTRRDCHGSTHPIPHTDETDRQTEKTDRNKNHT